MWKWILGSILVLFVLLAGTCYFGYRKLASGGNTASVTIAGSVDRIFAALASPDSISQWMGSGTVTGPLGHGMLAPGDTLRLTNSDRRGNRTNSMWIVREVSAPSLLVMAMTADSGSVMMIRRDSLTQRGDSTAITSTFQSPLMDSVRNVVRDSSRGGAKLVGVAQNLMVGVLRAATEAELQKLKGHVEGR